MTHEVASGSDVVSRQARWALLQSLTTTPAAGAASSSAARRRPLDRDTPAGTRAKTHPRSPLLVDAKNGNK